MSRVNLDVILRLEDELETLPLDMGKWEKLLAAVKTKDKEEQVRRVFEKYLAIFKNDGKQWCVYINYELARGEFTRVEQLFGRCLEKVALVEVLRLYVLYVRRVNDVITGGDTARRVVIAAFEYAVKLVGIDLHLGELWGEYIAFLNSWAAAALWEQQQKVDNIRKVYRRMLAIPMVQIEHYWQQYLKWEAEVNQATALKFILERLAEYMAARLWKTEWLNLTRDALHRELIPYNLNSDKKDLIKGQLELWRRWLEFEQKNSLDLKDLVQVAARVEYCLRQATQVVVFAPQTWFAYARWWFGSHADDRDDRGLAILRDGVLLNPRLLLLLFALAERYEHDNAFDKASEVYTQLLALLQRDYDKVHARMEAINTKMRPKENGDPPQGLTKDDREDLRRKGAKEDRLQVEITTVWVAYMVAAKRAQGIKEARLVFKAGRKQFANVGPDFYVENALLEHYNDNQKTAIKVFELAHKQMPTNGKFLWAYLRYLIQINDVDNIRKLIQLADLTLSKEIALLNDQMTAPELSKDLKDILTKQVGTQRSWLKRLLKEYIRYAHAYLLMDVADLFILKYEQLFPGDDPIELFTDRYRSDGGTNVINHYELDSDDEEDDAQPKRRKTIKVVTEVPVERVRNDRAKARVRDSPVVDEEPQFVTPAITNLLKVLPNSLYFGHGSGYNPGKLVQMFANLPNVNTKSG